jgi:hypothetical protein
MDAPDDCVLIEFSDLADFVAMEKGLGTPPLEVVAIGPAVLARSRSSG